MYSPKCPNKRPISVLVSALFSPINSSNLFGNVTLQTRLENIVGYKISFSNITAFNTLPASFIPTSHSASLWAITSRSISSMGNGNVFNIARTINNNKSTAINESNIIGFITNQPTTFNSLQPSAFNINSYTPFGSTQWVESFDWGVEGINTNLLSAGAGSVITIEFMIDFYQECYCS